MATDREATKRYRMCERKKAYSRMTALLFAQASMMRAYECPYCQRWHLTSKEKA